MSVDWAMGPRATGPSVGHARSRVFRFCRDFVLLISVVDTGYTASETNTDTHLRLWIVVNPWPLRWRRAASSSPGLDVVTKHHSRLNRCS